MIIALNNKSNLDKHEFEQYKEELSTIITNHQLILCPTFLNINYNFPKIIELGAQNVSCQKSGAYTGEISAEQLSSYGVKYCIVGHSERRENQKETNDEIKNKIHELLKNNIIPILCVGETYEEKEKGQTEEKIKDEIITAISELSEEEKEKLIIAYEPIWSIGTGKIPTNMEIETVLKMIKSYLPTSKLLYGGSANEENIVTLKEINQIDGYLLGGLSLKINKLKIFLDKCN